MPSKSMATIVEAVAADNLGQALALSSALLTEHQDCPYLFVWHAVLIQVQVPAGDHTLEEAEECLLREERQDT